MKMLNLASQKERGFTLVELAIVLIIIGLLIGGTLKGQELINGARVTATTAQIKALEAGTLTFQDTYNGFPGDLANAATRLPNCSGTGKYQCQMGGDTSAGDGRLGPSPQSVLAPATTGTNATAANESFAFFNHLFNADLLDGIDGTAGQTIGTGVLGAKLGSAKHYRVGYMASGVSSIEGSSTTNTLVNGPAVRPGHYLFMTANGPTTAVAVVADINNKSLTPSEAARIDAKYDDGAPNTGNALAAGAISTSPTANSCRSAGDAVGVYLTGNRQNDCALYIRFSN